LIELKEGGKMGESMWSPRYETMEREEMRQLQLERLQASLQYLFRRVPFYKERLVEHNVGPGDLNELEDLSLFPFTTKEMLLQGFPYSFFAVPMRAIARIHTSSGTTGRPIVVGYTKRDLKNWGDLMARLMVAAGVGEQDVVQISFNYGLFTGGFGFHHGAEQIGATIIPASAMSLTRQISTMQNFRATALVSLPSHALRIAHHLEEADIDPHTLSLRIGLFGAEPWSESTRQQIEEKLLIKATDNYGLAEMGGPGVSFECSCCCGLHINEDHFYPEVVNPETGEVLPEGEEGELVLTTLTKEAIPLLRYRTGDITALNYEPCPCGRTLVRMARVKGRVDDMFILHGVNIFPNQVEEILLSHPEVGPNYRIELYREKGRDLCKVEVEAHLASREEMERVEDLLGGKIQDTIGVEMEVNLLPPGSIEPQGGKQKVVVDKRKI